ncbi:MAG: RNA-binding protein [Deltaproteobacteria bacterium RIFOXYD12_FULL_57_12]|nr:MAG: RNA-binding protein [Deltaproteobacteria bacterium RIFOXYD12_FULL_57_12]
MCQMRVVLEQDGQQEKIMDGVTLLETTPAGVRVSTFFEAPKLVAAARVQKIDFLAGTVTLVPVNEQKE